MNTVYKLQLGDGMEPEFSKNGRKRFDCGNGDVFVNAKVKAADGTMFSAVMEVDETAHGEICGVIILLDDGIAVQGQKGFLKQVGKTKKQFFPYKYKLSAPLKCRDIHVGEDGWSK